MEQSWAFCGYFWGNLILIGNGSGVGDQMPQTKNFR